MLTLGETAFGAGGSNGFVYHLGVNTGGVDNLGLLFTAVAISCSFTLCVAGSRLSDFPFAIAVSVHVGRTWLAGRKAENRRSQKST